MSAILDSEKTWVQRDFGLDRRLVKALSKLGYVHPTLVQSKSLPIALQGKDLLVRARTGSGKTVAFGLPILHKILTTKDAEKPSLARIHCIILAPTKELCKQIEKNMTDLTYYCRETISLIALLDDNAAVQKYKLQNKPDIIISTPAKLVAQIKAGLVDLSSAKLLVIDEADLVLSFGYTADVHSITSKLPKIFQGLFMSATLSPELDKFKRVVLHNPAVLKLEEAKGVGHLLQFFLESTEDDKFLILYVFMRLGLLQGKGLIFVNDVNKCYRLKLFLQQFYISAAVLNSEVPLNSRLHMLDEFNRGVFDYLIATDTTVDRGDDDEEGGSDEEGSGDEDENEEKISDDEDDDDDEDEVLDQEKAMELGYDFGGDDDDDDDDDDEEEEEEESNDEEGSKDGESSDNKKKTNNNKDDSKKESSKKRSRPKSTKTSTNSDDENEDYGVARGIDFQAVNFVINFDFPKTAAAYTHRIGRTARGGASGTALSFVTIPGMKDTYLSESATAKRNSETLAEVRLTQPRLGNVEGDNILAAIAGPAGATQEQDESTMQPAPLVFNMKELESFRYRVYDTLRSVTSAAVKEFRTAEIKREILNSTKLKTFFMENPNDLKVLRHDKAILHPIKQKDHLKHVPDYLIPASMRSVANTSSKRKKRKNMKSGHTAEARSTQSRMKDPLQNPDLDINTSTNDNNEVNDNNEENDNNEGEEVRDNVYTNTEQLGKSISGRKAWQIKHQKGKFNQKANKKNSHRTPGSFLKSKQYK